MRTSYNPEADAMFVWFGPEGVKSAAIEEEAAGIMLDFNESGEVIDIEILLTQPARREAQGGSLIQPDRRLYLAAPMLSI